MFWVACTYQGVEGLAEESKGNSNNDHNQNILVVGRVQATKRAQGSARPCVQYRSNSSTLAT